MIVFLFLDQIRLRSQNYYLMVYTSEYLWFLLLLLCCMKVMYGFELKYQIHHRDKSYYSPLRTKWMQLSGEETKYTVPKVSFISEQWYNQCFREVDCLGRSCTFSWHRAVEQCNLPVIGFLEALCYLLWDLKMPSFKARHADACLQHWF